MFLQTGIIGGGGSAYQSFFGAISGGLDLMLVLDSSGSMGFQSNLVDINGNPCKDGDNTTDNEVVFGVCQYLRDWQKQFAVEVVRSLPQNANVGIVEFDSDSNLTLPLTSVGTGLQIIIDAINATDSDGTTNIGSGIASAYTEITENTTSGYSKQVLVFSDGVPTNANGEEVVGTWEAETLNAVALGVDYIHSVALPGASVDIMQGIASIGGGSFIDATDDLSILDSLYNSN